MSAITFTVTVTAFQLSATEPWTVPKLNQLGNPTVSVVMPQAGATDGQVITWNEQQQAWVPTALPVASMGDTFNRLFAWSH